MGASLPRWGRVGTCIPLVSTLHYLAVHRHCFLQFFDNSTQIRCFTSTGIADGRTFLTIPREPIITSLRGLLVDSKEQRIYGLHALSTRRSLPLPIRPLVRHT